MSEIRNKRCAYRLFSQTWDSQSSMSNLSSEAEAYTKSLEGKKTATLKTDEADVRGTPVDFSFSGLGNGSGGLSWSKADTGDGSSADRRPNAGSGGGSARTG